MRLYHTFQKVLEMVLHTVVQYCTLIFVLNIGRQVGFYCCSGKSVAHLEARQTSTMELFSENRLRILALLVAN